MKKEELIAKAKLRVRKTSKDILDEDVGQLVEVAVKLKKNWCASLIFGRVRGPVNCGSRPGLYKSQFWEPRKSQ